MPYNVVHVPGGCKVKKAQPGRPRFFSKKTLSCKRAKQQQKALYAAEGRRKTMKKRRSTGL
jgi:hypothetical protein